MEVFLTPTREDEEEEAVGDKLEDVGTIGSFPANFFNVSVFRLLAFRLICTNKSGCD